MTLVSPYKGLPLSKTFRAKKVSKVKMKRPLSISSIIKANTKDYKGWDKRYGR